MLAVASLTFDALLPSACTSRSLFFAGFVELYRDGEVIQAVVTCSFFLGSILYGVRNPDNWVQVERLQFLVWAILSGTTCWLVSVLGRHVHAVSVWCYMHRCGRNNSRGCRADGRFGMPCTTCSSALNSNQAKASAILTKLMQVPG